ncbi:MAG: DUF3656 domain-containing U32 family peptidase [Bacillota bacterium]|jgi:putative protease
MTEILAPAGNKEAFWAAIANGADAIYVGSKDFSARAFAENFSDDQLAELIELAHLHKVKVYLAINTLLTDAELPQALSILRHAYERGVDAVIVQDLGLVRLLKKALPALPVHASTQMSIFNASAVNFMAKHGIKRVILARELSLAEIAQIKKTSQAELEVFVHGALCIGYSGQCLMSGLIGGRSGNRGKCAQPCRLEYEFIDQDGQVYGKEKGKYLLSPRDLYGYTSLDQLVDLDLAALKIEGRMKRPEYVATVTRIYRQAWDALHDPEIKVDHEENLRQLMQIFNRDYCSGYWQGNPGSDLMGYHRPNNRGVFIGRLLQVSGQQVSLKLEQPLSIGDGLEIWVKVGGRQGFVVEKMLRNGVQVTKAAVGDLVSLDFSGSVRVGDRVFKTSDCHLNEQARDSFSLLPDSKIDMIIVARLGQNFALTVQDEEGHQAKVIADYVVEEAKTSPSDWPQIRKQLGRLGGSGFVLKELSGHLDQGVMLPSSVLNQSRREAVELLKKQLVAPYQNPPLPQTVFNNYQRELRQPVKSSPSSTLSLTALVLDDRQAESAVKAGITDLYITAESFAPVRKYDWRQLTKDLLARGVSLTPLLPRIIHESEKAFWLKRFIKWQEVGVNSLLVPNLNSLALLKEAQWQGQIYADSGFNVFNRHSGKFLWEAGVNRLLLSPELNLQQLELLGDLPLEKELTVHGAAALMVSEYCVLGALCGGRTSDNFCSFPCRQQGQYYLKDNKGYAFPCRFDQSCRMHVFNSRSLCLLSDLLRVQKAGISKARLDLRLYTPKMAAQIIACYGQALMGDIKGAQLTLSSLNEEYTKGHLYRGV